MKKIALVLFMIFSLMGAMVVTTSITSCSKKVVTETVDLKTLPPFDKVTSIALSKGVMSNSIYFKDFQMNGTVIRLAYSASKGPAIVYINGEVATAIAVENNKYVMYSININTLQILNNSIVDNKTAQEFAFRLFRELVDKKLI